MLDVIFSFFAPFLKYASPIDRWWPWRIPVLFCRRALLVALLVQDEEIDAAVEDVLVCSIFGCDSRHLAQIPNLRHAEQSTYSTFELYNINKISDSKNVCTWNTLLKRSASLSKGCIWRASAWTLEARTSNSGSLMAQRGLHAKGTMRTEGKNKKEEGKTTP